jgi:hypothetical protein
MWEGNETRDNFGENDWIGDCGHDEINMYTDVNQNIFREMMIHMKTRNTLELTMESRA